MDPSQLAALRAVRDATTDPVQRAALEAAIAALEIAAASQLNLAGAQTGDVSTGDIVGGDLAKDQRRHELSVTGGAVDVAVAGDVHGNIFVYGKRAPDRAALLAGYLDRLARRCGTVPLDGLRDQRAVGDTLRIGLDRVYTELATQSEAYRETVNRDDAAGFDAVAFLARHTGARLPREMRTSIWLRRMAANVSDRPAVALPDAADTELKAVSLSQMDAEQLARLSREHDQLTFLGPQLVTEAIAADRHLVLLGEPGSGKSTALRYLALNLARAGLDEGVDLGTTLEGWAGLGNEGRLMPIFLPLLPFAQQLAEHPERPAGADDLWNYIADRLEPGERHEGLAAAIYDELDAGTVLLMLDGLDEVAGTEARSQVVRAVQTFGESYPRCRIVVSCRVRAYVGAQNRAWQLSAWQTVVLADWNQAQMLHFVDAWYGAAAAAAEMSNERRDERASSLRRAIAEREDLRRIGLRPLLMTIMALVHFNDQGQLPEERVTLYSRCVDLLLGQWELAREDGSAYGALMNYIGLPSTDVKALRPLLEAAAFRAHAASSKGSPGVLGADDLRLMVADFLEQRGHPNAHQGARRFLEYTDARAGLLQASDAGDAFVFPHLTFQEYLAGRELVSGVGVVQRILALRDEDRWRVPILLGVGDHVSDGKLEMPLALLSELVAMEGRDAAQEGRDLLLAAEIAEDVGWVSLERGGAAFRRLRRDLAAGLARVVEGSGLPAADRVHAGVYLGAVGDSRPGVCDLRLEMVKFVGGSFQMGITETEYETIIEQERASSQADDIHNWYRDTLNSNLTMVQLFWLARYPVTNAQYQLFIGAGGYNLDAPWWSEAAREWLRRDDNATDGLASWQRRSHKDQPEFWDDLSFGKSRPNYPVVGVSWYEATAFCNWLTEHLHDGYLYFLPSEAEWEYAARGLERRVYPWGVEEPNGERASYDNAHGGTSTVGCFAAGATPERLLDMAGNVWEWTRSVYRSYPYHLNDGREDKANLAKKHFTLRGGSWADPPFNLRAVYRGSGVSAGRRYQFIGFRLARRLSV